MVFIRALLLNGVSGDYTCSFTSDSDTSNKIKSNVKHDKFTFFGCHLAE